MSVATRGRDRATACPPTPPRPDHGEHGGTHGGGMLAQPPPSGPSGCQWHRTECAAGGVRGQLG